MSRFCVNTAVIPLIFYARYGYAYGSGLAVVAYNYNAVAFDERAAERVAGYEFLIIRIIIEYSV